ncbi:DUF222 domain-containing protein [Aeromicrobium sp.]|uniref:HNH endonuclease signature motif containing protein n=1 Tax=Aeromicrobium sp. TaxID=1871063 RepID=UPI0030BE14A1
MTAPAGVIDIVHGCATAFPELVEAPLWALTDDQVATLMGQVQVARSGLEELESRLIRLAEEREIPRAAGAASTTAWVSQVSGLSKPAAARIVSTARMIDESCDPTRRAWASGELTSEHVRVICAALDKLPDWFGLEERMAAQIQLIGLAGGLDLDGLRKAAHHAVEVIDPDGADELLGEQLLREEARAWDATRLEMRRRGDGTTRGTFVMPDADVDILRAAVEGLAAPRRKRFTAQRHGLSVDDVMSLPHVQRLGLALVELVNHLPADSLPQHGGLAATVAVTVPIDVMRSGFGTGRTTGGTEISGRRAQRLACNATLVALYLDSESKALDLGTSKRLYDRHQRLVLAIRDQGCCWAGCDRPPSFCEAHHLNFWSEDGPTDLDNAALFCFFHHHLLHEGDWQARMAGDGVVEVIPPARVDPERIPRRHARFTQLSPRAA